MARQALSPIVPVVRPSTPMFLGNQPRITTQASEAVFPVTIASVRILISAGEASGEMYGAQLIQALCRRDPSMEFFGVGGQSMREAGCDTVVDASDLSVVGITEILGRLPKIWGLFHKLIEEADRRLPDLAIVIDSPAFNWRVARQMKKRGIPVIYYVAPQFWAWRQGRVKLLRKYVTKALVIFPFEERFYRKRRVDASFVGHPLAELPVPSITREAYAAQHNLDLMKRWVTIMPGSRVKEVRMNLPTMLDATALLGPGFEFLLPIAPTLEREVLEKNTRGRGITLVSEALPALYHARAAIVASGTATVEAAMMGTPFVMVYRVSQLTYALGKPRIKVPYFAMVNLIAREKIVPELVQGDFTAERVVARLREIIPDSPARTTMLEGLARVKARLRSPDAKDPRAAAERAADAVLASLAQPAKSGTA
jgi:lipid-A-disaccharide synthase